MRTTAFLTLGLRPVYIMTLAVILPLGAAYCIWDFYMTCPEIPDRYPEGEYPNIDLIKILDETLLRLFESVREASPRYRGLVRTVPGSILGMDHSCELAGLAVFISGMIQAGVLDMPMIIGYIEYICRTLEGLSNTVEPEDYHLVERLFNQIFTLCVEIREIIWDNTTISQSPDNSELFNRIQPKIELLFHKFSLLRVSMERDWDVGHALANTYNTTKVFIPKSMSSVISTVEGLRDSARV